MEQDLLPGYRTGMCGSSAFFAQKWPVSDDRYWPVGDAHYQEIMVVREAAIDPRRTLATLEPYF